MSNSIVYIYIRKKSVLKKVCLLWHHLRFLTIARILDSLRIIKSNLFLFLSQHLSWWRRNFISMFFRTFCPQRLLFLIRLSFYHRNFFIRFFFPFSNLFVHRFYFWCCMFFLLKVLRCRMFSFFFFPLSRVYTRSIGKFNKTQYWIQKIIWAFSNYDLKCFLVFELNAHFILKLVCLRYFMTIND